MKPNSRTLDIVLWLWALAMLELRQHEALWLKQGLDPLAESDQAQYRAKKSHRSTKNWTRAGAEAVKNVRRPGVKVQV